MKQGILVLDLKGTHLTEDEARLFERPAVAGVIIFARNFQSRQQLVKLVSDIRSVDSNLLIMTDHEGGRVQRFREGGFTRIPSMGAYGKLYKDEPDKALAALTETGWLVASELAATGIDLGLSPVLDLDRGISRVIGDRGFSQNPDEIAVMAKAFIEGLHEGGMASIGKHFPGHGGVGADSHIALPVDARELSEVEEDLKPYRKLIGNGLDAVMPAHVQFPSIDQQAAGFSKYWLKTVLRDEMGFQGAVFSDCLSMAGASIGGTVVQRAEKAMDAGCDLVLVCNNPGEARKVVEAFEGYDLNEQSRQSHLAPMRGCSSITWDELEKSERRQSAIEMITRISSK
ncbi:beta-N-acetylhexosaminidase [Sansalvadorimonas sp. 2012CJ34-2]|uniref:Beta-hexosaminidase n=1 Tax=Parendozoicomonas callyspongiae TaxID=2942213 RepID=A0ABT0PEL2_9GAMM|nr:beta-N-acetylhexosaminidase [Sansalvadorimonas sp. 2012CJ34-2]MCL6269805.1 beta-N-acetylhexosaminidase [Sansalvadorimonas sp. 2012CJ34-2]